MQVRISDEGDTGEMPSWSGTDQVLAILDGLPPEDGWIIHTGDGYMNPVIRFAPVSGCSDDTGEKDTPTQPPAKLARAPQPNTIAPPSPLKPSRIKVDNHNDA